MYPGDFKTFVAHKLHTSLVSTTDTIAELRGLSAGDSGWFPGTFKSILKAYSTRLYHKNQAFQNFFYQGHQSLQTLSFRVSSYKRLRRNPKL